MKFQFLRFALVGTAATITTYATLVGGVESLNLNAVTASIIGYMLGMVVNYTLNYRYTFDCERQHQVVAPKFLLVMLIGMLINAGVMFAGINWLGIHYLLAQLAAVAVVFMLSFTANRMWTFTN